MPDNEDKTQVTVTDIEANRRISRDGVEEATSAMKVSVARPAKDGEPAPESQKKRRVAIAFQGGVFPAGAMHAGVVKYLVEAGAFDDPEYDIDAFSGTSAGALVASVCWGHKMRGTMKQAPEVLEDQWLQFAFALVPTPFVARTLMLADELWRLNPLYDLAAQKVRVPATRWLMKKWVMQYVRPDELVAIRDGLDPDQVPVLALGAANVLTGEPTVFSENDFRLETVLASGSLEEVNGVTTISAGRHAGTYCDGAWGTNPPISFLLDKSARKKVDVLWIIEFWPKVRSEAPKTHLDRKDRKDELWQNSLVEHEIAEIERVNRWLDDGTIAKGGRYRHIEIKRMPMTLPLEKGATFVNTPSFIRKMMAYGYASARSLYSAKKKRSRPTIVVKAA